MNLKLKDIRTKKLFTIKFNNGNGVIKVNKTQVFLTLRHDHTLMHNTYNVITNTNTYYISFSDYYLLKNCIKGLYVNSN